ncbi:MAG: poly-beta-1,6-N-acetyl-D-glucosamine N-deacetylase PgaB [Pseudomonadota bacterium]|nr:poly-beta-1,6-N-acetyl-D-glucosamine N-deacetylase PgaB [Pseudomonadota bacterium]
MKLATAFNATRAALCLVLAVAWLAPAASAAQEPAALPVPPVAIQSTAGTGNPRQASPLLAISYHDIRDDVATGGDADGYATSTRNFAAHLDWLAAHGYVPVSLDAVVASARGGPPLPERAVLLTFDDGLRSHYTHAFPLLRAYGFPAVMAVVTRWVDLPADTTVDYGHRLFTADDFLTWEQLREMRDSGLVDVASHSHDLHRGVLANPQGNMTPAAITRVFDLATGTYESESAYRARIRDDLAASSLAIQSALGVRPRAVVWPYAAYSSVSNAIADELGMEVSFDLEGRERPVEALHGLSRLLLANNPDVGDFVLELRRDEEQRTVRAVQVDLDYVYDADPVQLERNLDVLIERIKGLGPTHVFLQAFADADGNGSADALYFPNRHLPVRADLYSRVAWQLKTRAGVAVFAWLPVLGYEPADAALRERLAIDAEAGSPGEVFRLDPSNPEVRAMVGDIYEDLAIASYLEGLLFHDDAYLRQGDTSPTLPMDTVARTDLLVEFTTQLTRRAERWRPKLLTVRNLFARPVLEPASEAWFAQRLETFLAAYDYTALMAMPWMEGASDPDAWLIGIVDAVAQVPGGLEKTIFQLQTVDWRTRRPIPGTRLESQMRSMQAAGARHLAYYPDDFVGGRPEFEPARAAIGARRFPYPPR